MVEDEVWRLRDGEKPRGDDFRFGALSGRN